MSDWGWGGGGGGSIFRSLGPCYSVPGYTPRQLGFPVWKTWENDFLSASFPLQETHEIVAIKKFKDSEGIYSPPLFLSLSLSACVCEYSLFIMLCFET